MFTLTFIDGGMPRAHRLRDGETIIGRAPTCDLTITAPLMSRVHARVRVAGKRVYLRDAGSTYGTMYNGASLAGEQEIASGETFAVAQVVLTLEREVAEEEFLSDAHQPFDASGTIVRPIDPSTRMRVTETHAATISVRAPEAASVAVPAVATPVRPAMPSAALAPPKTPPSGSIRVTPSPGAERRHPDDRRRVDVGRAPGERRNGRERRGGRHLRLLTEIGKTLVTVQPLEQILARVVDLVFEVLPAERSFLLLRDAIDQPLTARVMRNRDGSIPANVTLSRTIVNQVMRERVAMLAKDALYDQRLDASGSIQAMNIRSFMCAPLWNRNDVIGVLYCDNPRSKTFTADDLEVFTALCNYAAVAIEQGRLSLQLLEETRRRERLQRYHSPRVVSRILHAGNSDGAFVAQTRDVSVMFCDIVGFTTMCQHADPQAVGDLLNQFFGRMSEVVFEHDGTLDKFIGDAILAVFGAPFDQPDHAIKAVSTALAMRRELAHVNAERGDLPIRMRIAVNSGRALTGDIGSPKRREFTVLGDVVNIAERIESSVAEPDQIVISQHTRERLGDAFTLKSLGGVMLRGRDTELEVFDVLG